MEKEFPACLPDPLIVVDGIINSGCLSAVYSGVCQDSKNTRMAIKFAPIAPLLIEAVVYDDLKDIQGKCIPKPFGMFFGKTKKGGEIACIITEHAGQRVDRLLEDLPRQDKYDNRAEILSRLAAIHSRGYSLPDFAGRNIIKSEDGGYRLIDFEGAKIHENCGWSLAMDFHSPGPYNPCDKRTSCRTLFCSIDFRKVNDWCLDGEGKMPPPPRSY